jgi:hypothetical protein
LLNCYPLGITKMRRLSRTNVNFIFMSIMALVLGITSRAGRVQAAWTHTTKICKARSRVHHKHKAV